MEYSVAIQSRVVPASIIVEAKYGSERGILPNVKDEPRRELARLVRQHEA